MSSGLDRAALRVERFLWFFVAAVVGGGWVFYEPITGREVPGHAHPVFAALVAAALTFGGIDLRKVSRIRRELEIVAREAGVPANDVAELATRIAVLEVEDPQLVRALRTMSRAPGRRQRTEPGEESGVGPAPRQRTNRRNRAEGSKGDPPP